MGPTEGALRKEGALFRDRIAGCRLTWRRATVTVTPQPTQLMANFWKSQLSNRFNVNGAPVPWIQMSGNAGYLTVVDGSPLEVELSKIAGKLGVTKVSDEVLAEKKISRAYSPPKLNRFAKSSVKPVPQIKARKDDLFNPSPKVEAAPAVAPGLPEVAASTAPKLGKLKPSS